MFACTYAHMRTWYVYIWIYTCLHCVSLSLYLYICINYMCLFTYSHRLTFWNKHNPKGGSKCFFCANQHLEPEFWEVLSVCSKILENQWGSKCMSVTINISFTSSCFCLDFGGSGIIRYGAYLHIIDPRKSWKDITTMYIGWILANPRPAVGRCCFQLWVRRIVQIHGVLELELDIMISCEHPECRRIMIYRYRHFSLGSGFHYQAGPDSSPEFG